MKSLSKTLCTTKKDEFFWHYMETSFQIVADAFQTFNMTRFQIPCWQLHFTDNSNIAGSLQVTDVV